MHHASGTNLWQELEAGDRVWVRDEGESGAALDHLGDVCGAGLVRQVAEDAEDGAAGDHRGEGVQRRDDVDVSVDVVAELVERRVHHDVAEADRQREEHLGDRSEPDLREKERKISLFRSLSVGESLWLTLGLSSASHRGLMKYQIPSHAPFNVTARTSRIAKMQYGNSARK